MTSFSSSLPSHGRSGARGFTLIEILIVAALITVFAGLAIFGAKEMYDRNVRKGMYGEAMELATALSFAHDDLGFFPRVCMLSIPKTLLLTQTANNGVATWPGFDTYGSYSSLMPAANIDKNWKGPYAGIGEGGRSHTFVWMRLSDAEFQGGAIKGPDGKDLSLVKWPADNWGNPYVFYQVVATGDSATASNPKGLRLILNPTEAGDYFNAVVSYGPNGVPGHIDKDKVALSTQDVTDILKQEGLYIRGDIVSGGTADFTLKSVTGTGAAKLDETLNGQLALSLEGQQFDSNQIGITDPGSDDVYRKF